ncbi:MAG: decaprenyl-phosphate phosphoribosyltransferase [Candidatus Dadabacteria bacterium]|nr:decaprenyl-phosphate phosphoribosyltransferase [Candidatus Dadabacteria bacterium]
MKIWDILSLLRVHQWIKNLLIFAPPFFAGIFFNNIQIFIHMILAFFCFSLISSSTYIINDLTDINKDILHPTKKNRPIASGRISIYFAVLILIVCLVSSILISFKFGTNFLLVLALYLLLGIAYSLFLQYLVILDSFTIAAGFVLRIMAGGFASGTEVSSWLLLTTFVVSVLLAFGKRRFELSLVSSSKPFRKVLEDYNERFLDTGIMMFATTAIVTFAIYAVEIGKKEFLISVPFACYGVLRYLHIVQKQNGADPTDAFIKDKALAIAVFLWILVSALIVYFNDILGLLR